MGKKLLKTSCLIMSIILTLSVLAGCTVPANQSAATPTPEPAKEDSTQQAEETSTVTYPIKTDVKLTYWSRINGNVSPNFKSLGDTPFAKELEKQTGIQVEYLHPSSSSGEAFNLMIASGDLPDIIEQGWLDLPGGPEQAIQNEIIIRHNDVIDKYAPNLKKYLQENPNVDKMVKTDNGSYYGFPMIRGDDLLLTFQGLAIRNDWLQEVGLEKPTTIDEWYVVLKAFKEKLNKPYALSWNLQGTTNPLYPLFSNGAFIGAFGIIPTFYQENGVVKYGPYEKAYQEFIELLIKWYNEGLIEQNFATIDNQAWEAKVVNGEVGALLLNVGGGLGKFIPLLAEHDPKADLQPVPYPTLKKGETPKFGQRDNPYSKTYMTAITTKCKNVEIAARWLDYGYSEEGQLLFNFGIEGVSYKMVDGYPTMTDEVMKNPNGLSIPHAWSAYARATYGGAFIQRREYSEQYNQLPAQKEALKIWPMHDAAKYLMPPVTATPEESSEFAVIMNDVRTYVEEFTMKVLLGVESVENFDKYYEQLKKMGIERAIEIQQAALDRYNKR